MTRPTNLSYLPSAIPADENDGPDDSTTRPSLARPAAPLPARSANVIDARLCEELETLRRYLETAGYLLGQDPGLRYRYATEIGNLKHVEKMLGHLARVVEAADKDGAIERLPDAELKARLLRRPIAEWYESKH